MHNTRPILNVVDFYYDNRGKLEKETKPLVPVCVVRAGVPGLAGGEEVGEPLAGASGSQSR